MEPEEKKPKLQLQPRISSFIRKETLEETVSKLAARDGLSIHSICSSKFIQQAMSERGFSLPKDESAVMRMIHCQQEVVMGEVTKKVANNWQAINTSASLQMSTLRSKIANT